MTFYIKIITTNTIYLPANERWNYVQLPRAFRRMKDFSVAPSIFMGSFPGRRPRWRTQLISSGGGGKVLPPSVALFDSTANSVTYIFAPHRCQKIHRRKYIRDVYIHRKVLDNRPGERLIFMAELANWRIDPKRMLD